MIIQSKDKQPRKFTDAEIETAKAVADANKAADVAKANDAIDERVSRHVEAAEQSSLGIASILYTLGKACDSDRLLDACKKLIVQTLAADETEDLVAKLTWCKQGLDSLSTFAKEAAVHNRKSK